MHSSYRLANILARSAMLIEESTTPWPIEIQNREQKYFQKAEQGKEVQSFDISKTKSAQLGPFENLGESKLEAYNRLYCMFRYLQYIVTSKGFWKSRFGTSDFNKPSKIQPQHVPGWMQPPTAKPQVASLQDIQTLNPISPKAWPILWKRNAKFEFKSELDEHLEEIGTSLPSFKQGLQCDPRLYDALTWRDSLRREFRCRELGLNIHSLHLVHIPPNREEDESQTNLLQTDWAEVQTTFEELPDNEISILLVLRKLSEDEELWESDTILPNTSTDGSAFVPDPYTTISADVQHSDPQDSSQPRPVAFTSNQYHQDLDSFLDSHVLNKVASTYTKLTPEDIFPEGGEECKKHHDGIDVFNSDANLRIFQKQALLKVAGALPPARKTKRSINVAGSKLTNEEQNALATALAAGELAALSKEEADGETRTQEDELAYFQIQGAFEGTAKQIGPPLDLCLAILGMTESSNGRFKCNILGSFTTSEFYGYQANGAVYMCIKTFGEVFLPKEHAAKPQVALAVQRLPSSLRTFGGICKDQTGLGKTKTLLLFLALRARFANYEPVRPAIIAVPATLVSQWAREIKNFWPGFMLWICYSADDVPAILKKNVITSAHLKSLPSLSHMPIHMRALFDRKDKSGVQRSSIILTSYETWSDRSIYKEEKVKKTEGGESIKYFQYRSRVADYFDVLVMDEAHKAKNRDTKRHTSLLLLSAPFTWIVTATPMLNSEKDILALLELLWPRVLRYMKEEFTTEEKEWVRDNRGSDVLQLVDGFPEDDRRRLLALDWKRVSVLLKDARKNKVRIAEQFHVMENLCFLARSSTSVLKNYDPELPDINLSDLLKKHYVHTVAPTREPREEAEYQLFHLDAARRYIAELQQQIVKKIRQGPPRPGHNVAVFQPLLPERDLQIANFSVVLARFNSLMTNQGENTYVGKISQWRENGRSALDFIKATWRMGDPSVKTRTNQLAFLTYGSPTLRYALYLIATKVLRNDSVPCHKKIILGEALPISAWYMEIVLQHAYIGVGVMHSGLSQAQRSGMAKDFNDPHSKLQVLVLLADVSIVGLNLHEACSVVYLTSILRNLASEIQLWGRAIRITSLYDVHVYRKHTPNSYDDLKSFKQQDKIGVKLATKAFQPHVRELLVRLLNKHQEDVRAAHESDRGREILKQLANKRPSFTADFELEGKSEQDEHQDDEEARRRSRRQIKAPDRFVSTAYNKKGELRGNPTLGDSICGECSQVADEEDEIVCEECKQSYHLICAALEKRPKSTFVCSCCLELAAEAEYLSGTEEEEEDGENGEKENNETDDNYGEVSSDDDDSEISDESVQNPLSYLTEVDFWQFASELQLNDEEETLRYMINLPYEKVYTDEDLSDEIVLDRALRLLYAERTGEGDLRSKPSIHIKYDHLHTNINKTVKEQMVTVGNNLSKFLKGGNAHSLDGPEPVESKTEKEKTKPSRGKKGTAAKVNDRDDADESGKTEKKRKGIVSQDGRRKSARLVGK